MSEGTGKLLDRKPDDLYLTWDRIYRSEAKKAAEYPTPHISPLDSDHLRILSSSSFRRLQDKTQLFPLEKNDYARTRLTHSCEVAATAKSIGDLVAWMLKHRKPRHKYFKTFSMLGDIAYLSSLLHDIGNPPFGHYGEEIIRNFFKEHWGSLEYVYHNKRKKIIDLFPKGSQEYWDFCGFDGNAQALRVITKLEKYGNDPYGLNLTMSVISGIIKYPYDSKFAFDKFGKNKFGYFKSELKVIDYLKEKRLFFDGFRCSVAYVVEAADDISMAISDFEDGIKKGCITINDIIGYRKQRAAAVSDFRKEFENRYKENAKSQNEEPTIATAIRMLNSFRNELVEDTASAFVKMIDEWGLPYPTPKKRIKSPEPLIKSNSDHYKIVKMLSDIVNDSVYQNEQIIAPELKGETILSDLLSKMATAVLSLPVEEILSSKAKEANQKIMKLISKNYIDQFVVEKNNSSIFAGSDEAAEVYFKLHLILDHISGMTDSYAEQIHGKIK